MRRELLLVLAFVLLLRLSFLNQAIQGDDVYYLAGAQHAQIDPVHPQHARYLFQGEVVDMRGHPHPPLNTWMLAALLAIFGDIYEAPYHAAYIIYSLIAAAAMYALARRFSERPLAATLLFLVTPAFVVNGNSLEADIPLLAFWMAGVALFVHGRLALAAVALALAAMTGYQAVVATPVLWAYVWFHQRKQRAAWLVALTPAVVISAFQLWERATGGELPASVLAGYFNAYGLQQLANKLKNAAALTAHAGWIVFPALAAYAFRGAWPAGVAAALAGVFIDPHPLFWVSFGIGAMVIAWCVRRIDFLKAWVLVFFAAALVLFFAGSARYLLPIAAPVALLAAREKRLVFTAAAAQAAISLCLAIVNYHHWDGYRQFARSIAAEVRTKRVWINSELGLRYYTEADGALPPARAQAVAPGEMVVSSELAYPIPLTTGGGRLTPFAAREITSPLPFRLIALGSKSGYSTAAHGLRPFDVAAGPIDRVRAEVVVARPPGLSYLPMSVPEAAEQIAGGVHELEDGRWRWMADRAVILLKPPRTPAPLHIDLFLPEAARARTVRVLLDGNEVLSQALPRRGMYRLVSGPLSGSTVTILLDRSFTVPGDHRRLGAILEAVGFR